MATLTIGSKAPLFEGIDQNGDKITLEKLKGKKVVLYFYPKDDTPGCTAEACNLRDNHNELIKRGIAVIGVSADDTKSHKKFSEKYSLPFPLIADTDKSIIGQYGVWGEKNMYGKVSMGIIRTTYVIAEDGTIQYVFNKVDTQNHTQQILDAIS